jgi:hypothetical protein
MKSWVEGSYLDLHLLFYFIYLKLDSLLFPFNFYPKKTPMHTHLFSKNTTNKGHYCLLSFLLILLVNISGSNVFGQNHFLNFDGVDDHVVVNPNPPYSNTSLTLEAWIRTSGGGQNQGIVGFAHSTLSRSVELRLEYGKLQFGIWNGSTWQRVTSLGFVNTGNWTHVAVTRNNSSIRLYINGIFAISGTITNLGTVTELVIGHFKFNNALRTSPNHGFPGEIDEVRVWNVVRTASEILNNKDSELTGGETGLVAYYNFNQGICGSNNTALSLPQVTDISGNNHHGTLVNMTRNGCTSNFVCAGTPCSYPSNNVTSINNIVPTLSQWGLIILSILLLTFGVVAIRTRQLVLSGSQAESKMSIRQLPWDKSLFGKVLVAVALGLIGVFTLGILLAGYELTSADVPGSLLTIPLLAYLGHAVLIKE